MEWQHVLTIVGSNLVLLGGAIGITISLFMHMDNKSEKRSREQDSKMEEMRNETNTRMEEMRRETNSIIKSIQDDIRNFNEKWMEEQRSFHGRLCAIEERRKRD